MAPEGLTSLAKVTEDLALSAYSQYTFRDLSGFKQEIGLKEDTER